MHTASVFQSVFLNKNILVKITNSIIIIKIKVIYLLIVRQKLNVLKIIVLRVNKNDELDNDENDLDNSLRAVGMFKFDSGTMF